MIRIAFKKYSYGASCRKTIQYSFCQCAVSIDSLDNRKARNYDALHCHAAIICKIKTQKLGVTIYLKIPFNVPKSFSYNWVHIFEHRFVLFMRLS